MSEINSTEILKLKLPAFLYYSIFNNTVIDYIIAALIFIAIITVLRFVKFRILKLLKEHSKKTTSNIADMFIALLDTIKWPLFIVIALYTIIHILHVPKLIGQLTYYLLIIVATYYTAKSVQKAIDFIASQYVKTVKKDKEEADTTKIDVLKKILKGLTWIFALLFVITSLGYNISGAIVGLGVGGIVIGFALQNILNDIFASFTILFDKPFKEGDFIVIGNDLGMVKKIGIQSTRIQHLQGQELVIPNKELTQTRINNYKKMEERRVLFNLGVTYQTKTAKLERIPGIIEQAIQNTELTRFDRAHFKSYGDFALIFEIVYYITDNDYNKYMDAQQKINLEIKRRFEKEKIEFAYPTQTIFLENKIK